MREDKESQNDEFSTYPCYLVFRHCPNRHDLLRELAAPLAFLRANNPETRRHRLKLPRS